MKTELYATIKKEFEIFDKELRINPLMPENKER